MQHRADAARHAADIDPLLTVKLEQLSVNDGSRAARRHQLQLHPDGIETVQALVAAAPAMPPRIQVCAFSQPLSRQLAGEPGVLEVLGREAAIQQVRFLAEPSATAPAIIYIACLVPNSAVTDMVPEGVPGALLVKELARWSPKPR